MRNYRGLTKDGKWVYGWYYEDNGLSIIISLEDNHDWIVIPETVGQSTGYNYKSGKEAYQGDIFDAYSDGSRRFLRTIIWDDELARFQAPYSDGSGIQLFTKRECLLYEYVGTIHTHPELMEKL